MKNITEQWYKTIFNNSRDAIFIIEFSKRKIGKFVDVNREACRSLGYTKKELMQLSPDDISFKVSTNQEPSFSKKAFNELMRNKAYIFESVYIKKSGKKIPVQINAIIVKKDGQFVISATARDISKFKQNEDNLKKAEQLYKNFLDKTFDGIYKTKLLKPISTKQSVDKQINAIYSSSIIIECNDTYAEMYGYESYKKIIGKSLKSLYGNKLNTSNYNELKAFVKNKYSLEKAVTEEKDAKGNLKYFSNNAVGIVENGMLVGTWGMQSDITESVQTTNELRLREKKFRSIFEQSPLGLSIYNKNGEIVEVNEHFIKMMGSTREKLMGFNALNHAGNKSTRDAVKNMLIKGSGFYKGDYISATGNKHTVVKAWFKGLRNKNGKIIGGTSIVEDISIQVANERKLRLSEERFRTIFEQSPLGLLHFNDKGEIIEVNDYFVNMMGSSREKLIGFNSLKHAGDRAMRKAVKDMLIKGSAFYKGEYKSTTGNKISPMKVWFKGLRDETGKIIGGTAILEDISVQVENEKMQKESEEKYRTIFNSIDQGLFIFDLKTGTLLDVNQKVLELYGYSYEELIKLDIGKVSENKTPYSTNEALEYLQKAFLKPQIFEWHARKKDNTLFWAEVSIKISKISGIKRGIVSIKDITDRKIAKEKLKNSEARYRNLIETLSDPVIVHAAGKFAYVNDAAVKLVGVKKYEDLIGKNVLQFVHPDYHEFAMKRMLNSGNILPVAEEKFIKADGTSIDVEVSGSKLLFKGKPATQLVIRDITERKHNEKIQNSLFKISQAAVKAVNLDHFFKEIHTIIKGLMPAENFYIALYNKKSETLTFPYFVDEYDEKVPEGTAVGHGFTAYVLKTGKSLIIDKKMENKLLKTGKIKIVGADSKIWIGIILKYKNEIIGVLALQDYHNENVYGENEKQILTFVSEQIAQAIVKIRTEEKNRKYMEELEAAKNEIEYAAKQLQEVNDELRISEEKLKETNANKDKFFSILSHDLRSPFTALLGYSQLLEEAYGDLTEEEKILSISSLHRTAKNIFELLTGLLEWSRTQTGRMEYSPEKIILYKVVVETISILEMNAEAKRIKFVNKLNKLSFAVADRNMIRTVLRNLLSNAVKFTKENGKVEISGKTVKGLMQITVADNGTGMEKSDVDLLFKIEEHHTTLGTNHEVGTGVGLILCKELVEKNGGKIWVESKVGKGSKFIFTLKKS